MRLESKVAVVTGAGSGMGREIALLFAKEGAKVVVSDLNEQSAQATVAQITENKGDAIAVISNVAVEADVQKMIDTAVEKYGTVDILINNAGIMDGMVPVHELTDEQWERVIAVNTTGPMRAIRKTLPIFMEKGRGTIVNIASVGGLFGARAGAAYTTAKHGVVGLTKNVGYQYAKLGIRCNAIAPGGVNTNIGMGSSVPNEFGLDKSMAGMGVMPRMGEPSEIAKVALFLASEESSFVNGTVVTADAGWTSY
ncbi:SDR family oxidoreductase [Paenibacillus gorillae]|uniref:SDR family oxidoreductase n=1 Tax=Paenibacillus gorillae TaxID=1243662 RepID=UPI0004B3CA89|nr:SDR family oxidoreductase [Paenibacillus gorillae]